MSDNGKETPCATGCGRAAEEGKLHCAECNLEWSLFHRETRAYDDAGVEFPVPESGPAIPAPTA